ncbi:hypothetical protein ABZW11_24150 [Nonomuraea sp. NPDC004580]
MVEQHDPAAQQGAQAEPVEQDGQPRHAVRRRPVRGLAGGSGHDG